MKKSIICLFAFVAFVASVACRAETGAVNILTSGTVTNATTRTNGFTDVKVDNNEIASLQVAFQGTASSTGAVKLTFARSMDGAAFETTPRQTIGFALSSTAAVVGFTNLTQVGAAHTLRLISAQNDDNSASATNCTISVVKKVVKVK
jgi:hypothetical protein